MMEKFRKFTELQTTVKKFVQDRNWQEFHNPKDLAVSISIEAAELLRLFNWKNDESSKEHCKDNLIREKLGDEIADIIILCSSLANTLGFDIGELTKKKVEKNIIKYPIELADHFSEKWK